MGNVPAQRQALYVRKEVIAHAAHKRLVGAGVEVCNAVLEYRRNQCDGGYHYGYYPNIAFKVLNAAEQRGKHGERALGRGRTYNAVYREAYYLRNENA